MSTNSSSGSAVSANTEVPPSRGARVVVSAAYAAQGLGYAVVVTSLPGFKQRLGIDDTAIALIILLVCATAAVGSVLADLIATRAGSRIALTTGLALEVVGIAIAGADAPLWLFVVGFAVYGTGLGAVDAAGAMQGVLVQRAYGRDLMGGFFAAYTAAAIVGAFVVAGAAALAWGVSAALGLVSVIAAGVAVWGFFTFDRARSAALPGATSKLPLPRRGIWLFGFVILAAFTLDSGVSTWSTVYLQDDLAAMAAIAPLGYAAYQIAILLTRLASDRVVGRWGARPVVMGATVISLVGLAVVAFLPFVAAALVGFALAGVSVGALVPLAFTSAGQLAPLRSDEIIARVNLFNYVGAVLGAVVIGLLADAPGLEIAFLIPAALLVPVFFTAHRFRAAVAVRTDYDGVPRTR